MSAPRHRLLRRVVLGLVGLLVLLAAAAYGGYRHYDANVTRVAVPSLGRSAPTVIGPPAPIGDYFLLAGSDTRALPDGASFQSTVAGDVVTGQRADTVILVHLPPGSAKATVLSFPRDAYVTIPAYRDAAGVSTPAHRAKLNEAFAVGGPDLLVRTIEDLTGLPVHHYLQVDFDGFRRIVDALGGVTLCIGTSRSDEDSGDHLTAGTHRDVKGDAALAFVRDRKGLAAGDVGRMKDQEYFLAQVMKKVLSAGTLANPLRLNALLSAVTDALTVDSGFGLRQFRLLGARLSRLDPAHVSFLTLPITDDNASRVLHGQRQSVVLLDDSRTAPVFAALAGRPSPPAPAPAGTAPPSPTATTAAATTCAV